MKSRLPLLALFSVFFFSGCSERTFEFDFSDRFIDKGISKSVDESLKASSGEVIKEVETVKENSIQNLISKNGSFKCTWKIEKEEVVEDADLDNEDEEVTGGIEEGLVYVKGGDFLKEVVIKENNRENKVSILSKNGELFQWSSLTKQGNKMTLEQAVSNEIIDLNKGYEWACEEIELEDELFKTVSDVEFINFSQYIEEDMNS